MGFISYAGKVNSAEKARYSSWERKQRENHYPGKASNKEKLKSDSWKRALEEAIDIAKQGI